MRNLLCSFALLALSASIGHGTTHTVTSSGFTFTPSSLAIVLGDTVEFVIAGIHNAVEVSQATWNADDTTSNGGFNIPFGGGTLVLTDTGTHYYVCQSHASLGMKGTIAVSALPPPPPPPAPAAVTLTSVIDGDGNLSSTSDRVPKDWFLKLYKDSVGSGIVLDSVSSGASLTVHTLAAGTYVAFEADSSSWSNLARIVDGVPQGGGVANQQPLTLAAGDSQVVTFVHFAPHTIVNSGFTFLPESLSVLAGDTVHFALEFMHTAREVSESSWLADDTVSNGGFDLPNGGGSAVLTTPGTHYYVCVPHASIGMKGKITVVSGVALHLPDGWNLLSLPVSVTDSSVAGLFPIAVSKAFSYQGLYVEHSFLSNGRGYWIKFPIATSVSLIGTEIAAETLAVAGGWNIIGTISPPVATASVVQLGTTVLSQYFGYAHDLGYVLEDTLHPGFGYWVKVSQAGQLALGSGPLAQPEASTSWPIAEGSPASTLRPRAGFSAAAGELTFRDRTATARHLYVAASPEDGARYELPPLAPEGVLDVRFSGNRFAVRPDGRVATDVPIQISSAAYPLRVSWDLRETAGLALAVDGHAIAMKNVGETEITNPEARLSLRVSASDGHTVPGAFALHQNYPNPFNPTTTILYDLPEAARVTVKVYDILGREVVTLANGLEEAGFKEIEWQAGNFASGVYYYRLEAVSAADPAQRFVQVQKTLLLK